MATFKILHRLEDKRVNTNTLLGVMTIEDYLSIVEDSISRDDYLLQRGRETRRKVVFDRLRQDLKKGTVIPPISLASQKDISPNQKELELNEDDVYILDGLQRTYALIDIKKEIENNGTEKGKFLERELRFEIWLYKSVESLLYKMIVLNTGQTRMSMRHQIEILNKPFINDFKKYASETDPSINIEIFTWKNSGQKRERQYQYALADLTMFFLSFAEGAAFVEKDSMVVELLDKINFLNNYSGIKEKYGEDNIIYKEFTNLMINMDKLLCQKYPPASIPQEYENLEQVKDSQFDFYKEGNFLMKSRTFLSGFLGAFGQIYSKNRSLYEQKKKELFDLLSSNSTDDPLSLDTLIKVIRDLKAKSKRWGDTEREYFYNVFVEFINDKDGTKTFENYFWRAGIPSIVR